MNDEKKFNINETAEKVGISTHTLLKWYTWERYRIRDGLEVKTFLPQPIEMTNLRGKPKMWTESMIEELKLYKKNMVVGRKGINGQYSNPLHHNKKSCETVDN